MKSLVFDTSSLISIATNDLAWTLKPLREKFQGAFLITENVKSEIIDVPLRSKKFKLEGIMTSSLLADNTLALNNLNISGKTSYLLNLANKIFKARSSYINILHPGEVSALALAILIKADALVMDERTLRMLIEEPNNLLNLLNRKLHTSIEMDKKNMSLFREEVENIRIIRSTELMWAALQLGLFEKYSSASQIMKNNFNYNLLDGILWGLKLRGCSISEYEINEILHLQ